MTRRSVAVVALLVLVVASSFVAPAVAQSDESEPNPTPADYTLSQLRQGGDKPSNAPPSVRAMGTYGDFAVKTLPIHPLVIEGEDSPMWSFMSPGETVRRNYLQMHTRRGYGVEQKNASLKIAYWQVEDRTVSTENGTRTETVATNVTVHEQDITLQSGYGDPIRVDLHEHFDQKVRVTMCVQNEGDADCLANPGSQRWTFYHKSSKAAQAVQTTSMGGRLAWSFGFIVLPFAGFTAVTLKSGSKVLEQARAGPNVSLLVWLVALIVTVVGTALFWRQVSLTLIRAPWVFAILGGVLLGILATQWFSDQTYLAAALRLRLEDGFDRAVSDGIDENQKPIDIEAEVRDRSEGGQATTDGGEEAFSTYSADDISGTLHADLIPLRLVRGPDGERSHIRNGFWKFVARFRGARADLETKGQPRTSVDVEQGPYEELYFLDPESDEPVDYQPESHRIDVPDLVWRDEDGRLNANLKAILGVPALLGVSALLGEVLLASAAIGVLVSAFVMFVKWVATPVDGRFRLELAPAMYGNALGTVVNHASALGDVKSFKSLFEKHYRDKAQDRAKDRTLADDAEQTQMEELADRFAGDGNRKRVVDDDDDRDGHDEDDFDFGEDRR